MFLHHYLLYQVATDNLSETSQSWHYYTPLTKVLEGWDYQDT